MTFDYNFAVRVILILLAVVLLFVLVVQYNKKVVSTRIAEKQVVTEEYRNDKSNSYRFKTGSKRENFQSDGTPTPTIPEITQPVKASDKDAKLELPFDNTTHDTNTSLDISPIEDSNNEDYRAVDFETENKYPSECYPRDRLTAKDLLPQDANSKWAEVNPAGQGDVMDQNFLQAGTHFGVNTVGQSLRNPNLQLRSDPMIPKMDGLSPWNISTIDYDSNRRPFEIGNV